MWSGRDDDSGWVFKMTELVYGPDWDLVLVLGYRHSGPSLGLWLFIGPCRATRQAKVVAQARPMLRAVPGMD